MELEKALYLIPVDLGFMPEGGIHPPFQSSVLNEIRFFIAENASTARKFLKNAAYPHPLQQTEIEEFNEHTRRSGEMYADFRKILLENLPIGLMSEAGMPCVADPGHEIVALAHQLGVKVIPFHGPSSILQALTASGFAGQQFVFHGYLPSKPDMRRSMMKKIFQTAQRDGYTQIFMETPYRSNHMLTDLVNLLPEQAMLSVACEIGTPDEYIKTQNIGQWKKSLPDIHKKRCIFSLQA